MALGSTQSLTVMNTRNISWGKSGRFVGLTTLPLYVPIVLKSGSLNLLEPSVPVQACIGTDLPFIFLELFDRFCCTVPIFVIVVLGFVVCL